MRGAILPLPNTPSWRGTQLKKEHRTTLPFSLLVQEKHYSRCTVKSLPTIKIIHMRYVHIWSGFSIFKTIRLA
jgi:hypothetical protein